MTHFDLVAIAARWLRGTKRCHPVICESTSCEEAPDAIGWWAHGSIVVECKTSFEDFRRDKLKYVRYKHPEYSWVSRANGRSKKMLKEGYTRFEVKRMGTQRFMLCEPLIILPETIPVHAPEHGLLYVQGTRVRVIIDSPVRDNPNYESEIRLLRLHWGESFEILERPKEEKLPEQLSCFHPPAPEVTGPGEGELPDK